MLQAPSRRGSCFHVHLSPTRNTSVQELAEQVVATWRLIYQEDDLRRHTQDNFSSTSDVVLLNAIGSADKAGLKPPHKKQTRRQQPSDTDTRMLRACFFSFNVRTDPCALHHPFCFLQDSFALYITWHPHTNITSVLSMFVTQT